MDARTFSTIDEAVATWKEEAENTQVKSGVLCICHCYHHEAKIRETSPISNCMLLLPQDLYDKYVQNTREEDKDYRSSAHIVVVHKGFIRIRLNPKERDNYSLRQDVCSERGNVTYLLRRHLGERIRLGQNLRV